MTACLRADGALPSNVHAFTTLRHGAGSSHPPFDSFNLGNRDAADGDDPAVVDRNRAELVERFALPSAPRWLRQVHGTTVFRVDATGPDAGTREDRAVASTPTADAAVTNVPGVVVAVLTADCLPVVFAARDGSEVAVAHAGWRGLAAGVLERTVAAMDAPAAQLVAWMGPAAGPGAYEVGAEVREAFVGQDAQAADAFEPTRPGHWRVDLYALARRRLTGAGVVEVAGGGECTISDAGRFFSHRRDTRSGRMATVAWFDAPG
ncbi:peptidoglycan editing factor PgeF [Luteimonas vadosa]|uniref:Purine nucleoside phosphorylase n=1 Tax=Luteimonas vadosa TaxID=1165507 RepID=A0ABP9DMZ0_9GAMM